MQSTENTPDAKLDLDSLIRDLNCDDGYDLNRYRARHAATALTAERDRADRAEARIEQAKAVAESAGVINWEEDNYAAGAAHVAAALEATA